MLLTHGVENRRLRQIALFLPLMRCRLISKHFAKNRLTRVTLLPTTAKVMMQQLCAVYFGPPSIVVGN